MAQDNVNYMPFGRSDEGLCTCLLSYRLQSHKDEVCLLEQGTKALTATGSDYYS